MITYIYRYLLFSSTLKIVIKIYSVDRRGGTSDKEEVSVEPDLIHFGNWLRWQVADKRLKLKEFAANTGLSEPLLALWFRKAEYSEMSSSPDSIGKLVDQLGITEQELSERWKREPRKPYPRRGSAMSKSTYARSAADVLVSLRTPGEKPIHVPFSKRESQRIRAAASSMNLSVPDFILSALEQGITASKKPTPVHPASKPDERSESGPPPRVGPKTPTPRPKRSDAGKRTK